MPALARRERLLALAVIVAIPVELALCARVGWRRGLPPSFFVAPALDAALLAGGVVWLAARRAGGLRALGLGPARLGRLAIVALALGGLGLRLGGLGQTRALAGGALALELGLWAALALGLGGVDRVVPRPVLAVLRTEVGMMTAAWRALARRPIAQADGTFTTTRTSRVGMLVTMVIVLSLFEAPAVHALLHGARLGVHALVLLAHLYGIAWLAGDRRLMQESGHRIDGDALALALGARWRGVIPRAQLASVRRLDGERPPRGTLRLCPADSPNVELVLRAPATLTGLFGLRRRATRLALFADDPDALIAALTG